MIDLIRLAWLNTYRQKQRTAITAGTIAICTILLILLFALSQGFVTHSIENFTASYTGKLQAHGEEFRDTFDFYTEVENVEELQLAASEIGLTAAPRSFGFGLVAAGNKSAGGMFIGMDPIAEKQGFRMPGHMKGGEFVANQANAQAMIGSLLAINLEIEPGDEIIALVQAADGSMGNMLYTVAGIFAPVGDEFDRSTIMLHQADFDELFYSQGRIHQVAFNGPADTDLLAAKQALQKAAPNTEIMTWQELYVTLALMSEMMTSYMLVFALIFGLGAAIGVLNTLLMASYERLHEYGIMKAVGTTSLRLFSGTMLEGLMIGLLGSVVGGLVSLPLVIWLQDTGIDIRQWMDSMNVMGVAFDPIWRADLTLEPFIMVPAVMLFLSLLAAIYPALLVSRLNPTEAMREH
ncbi:MAG TPA: hypothetical protein DE179_00835 [Oceanospirillaceae bacterium]|nr:hypothetical protein [Oceanospirillaceae bacterium]